MLGESSVRTHVLFPRPTPMLTIPSPFKASPFCSSSFGLHFENTSEVFSTSASRSLERSDKCLSTNADALAVDVDMRWNEFVAIDTVNLTCSLSGDCTPAVTHGPTSA